MNTPKFIACILLPMTALVPAIAASAEVVIEYQYDAQGRVTFVKDGTNGNRDYDYDAAGNRTQTSVGQAQDDPVLPPAPPAPTGLSCSLIAPNVYRAQWTGSATYFIVRSTASTNPERQTSSNSFVIDQSGATCSWVKACNQSNVCSAKSNF